MSKLCSLLLLHLHQVAATAIDHRSAVDDDSLGGSCGQAAGELDCRPHLSLLQRRSRAALGRGRAAAAPPAGGGRISVTIDFRRAEFPPLFNKIGWLSRYTSHADGEAAETMAANAARRTPMNWALVELAGQHPGSPPPPAIFKKAKPGEPVHVEVPAWWKSVRRARGSSASCVLQFYQFTGCPKDSFNTAATAEPPGRSKVHHGHRYTMCKAEHLDAFVQAFVELSGALRRADALPSSFSFWQEPGHTLMPRSAGLDTQFRKYMDFYERVARALRKADRDNILAGWNLNAANAEQHRVGIGSSTSLYNRAVKEFLRREQSSKEQIPLDFFTVQHYRAQQLSRASPDQVLLSARRALGPVVAARRFDLTPVILSRLASKHRSHVPEKQEDAVRVLSAVHAVADAPDVAYAVLSKADNVLSHIGTRGHQARPLTRAVLERFHALASFRVPVDGGGSLVHGVAGKSPGREEQCALLWRADWWQAASRNSTVSLDLKLLSAGALPTGSFLDVQKLSAESQTFAPWERLTLEDTSTSFSLEFPPLSVVQLCLVASEHPGQPRRAALPGLKGVSYARHEVLVPRGNNASQAPAGAGHYDVLASTLHAAFGREPCSECQQLVAGVAAVILRNVTAKVIGVQLDTWPEAALRPDAVLALRLDFLDGGACLRSRLWRSAAAGPGDPFAEVLSWPGAAAEGAPLKPALLAPGAGTLLELGREAPAAWASADYGARRLRISLLARPRERSAGPFTAAARLFTPGAPTTAWEGAAVSSPGQQTRLFGQGPPHGADSETLFLGDSIWSAFKGFHVHRLSAGLGLVSSSAPVPECSQFFNGHVMLHLFDHPRFQAERRSPVDVGRLPRAGARRMAAVGFADMGKGCPQHYGHLVENVVLSLFVHFIERAHKTWALLGYVGSDLAKPKLFLPDLGGAMRRLGEWFPGLDIELVPWISQQCWRSIRGGNCSAIPDLVRGSVPLVQLSSDGLPTTHDQGDDDGSHAGGMGWGFLARNELVLQRLQQSAERLREYLASEVCAGVPWVAPSLLLVERVPGTGMHDRRIENFEAIVESGRALANARGLRLVTSRLENSTVREECAIFQNAQAVVLQHGAAGVNCVFMSPGTKVLEIASPSRRPVKFWCSDLLRMQYHRLLPKGKVEEDTRANSPSTSVDVGRFDRALRAVLDTQQVTGVGQHGVKWHLLDMLRWMVESSRDRYNPHSRSELEFDAICRRERAKAEQGGSSWAGAPARLLLVSGQGGSSTRAISVALQALPGVSTGPVSSKGQDSAVIFVPNIVNDDLLFGVAASGLGSALQPEDWPSGRLDAQLAFAQQGVCDVIHSLAAWQRSCHPTATHALLKEPLLSYLMPFVRRSLRHCSGVPYVDQKFVHVVRDPRIHHSPHKTIQAYDHIFGAEERAAHLDLLRRVLSIDPGVEIPDAYKRHNGTVWTALHVMKFAAAWQNRSLQLHRSWSLRRPLDYFLLRVDRVSPPTPEASIRAEYARLLRTIGVAAPGPAMLRSLVAAYAPYGPGVAAEPAPKLRITELFAGEAMRELGLAPA